MFDAELAFIPSPSQSVWDLGPVPIRAYALCIILGIVAAIWIGEKRWVARGGIRGTVSDVAVWAVIFGLVGGRLYHVITDNELYFRSGRDPWRALYVWEGGLGVWGAIALGGVGAWIGCRRRGIKLPPYADAVAPGIAVAQALGRWGNWFNQELFGRPTDVPWAVEIDPGKPNTVAGATTYHPTFLYESLWCLGLAGLLVWVDRRFTLGRGRVFALYVMGYTVGRFWIELLRIDTANRLWGVRINVWTCIVVFAGALVYFLLHRGPRETEVEPRPTRTPTVTTADEDQDSTDEPAAGTDEDTADDDEPAGLTAEDEPATKATADDDEPAGLTAEDEPATKATADDDEPAETPLVATDPADDPEPTADPEPESEVEPVAEAEPVIEPEPDPAPVADAEPVAEPEKEPVAEAEPVDEAEGEVGAVVEEDAPKKRRLLARRR